LLQIVFMGKVFIELPTIGKHTIVCNTLLLAKQQDFKDATIGEIYTNQWGSKKFGTFSTQIEIFSDIIYSGLLANAQVNSEKCIYSYGDVFNDVEAKWYEDPKYFIELGKVYAESLADKIQKVHKLTSELADEQKKNKSKTTTASTKSSEKQ